MPRESIVAEVDPEVMKWLRESSGWTTDDVAMRLKVGKDAVNGFESGRRKPTLRQATVLSIAFKRPLASFFLSKPKEEKPNPSDYRSLPDKSDVFDKKTVLAIRKARGLQEIGKELSLNIKYEIRSRVDRAKTSENPEVLAEKYRSVFKLGKESKLRFANPYQLFGFLRDTLEDMNILTFQFSMPVEDARGFVLSDESPSVIVVNSKDSIEARLFTLMHEFAHILLDETVIDIPDVLTSRNGSTESWCNEFSASFLLPKDIAREAFERNKGKLTGTDTLNALSRKYKVSKAMLLFNMRKLNFISKSEYDGVLQRYAPTGEKAKMKKGAKVPGIPSDKRCLSEVGNKFVSLVANNFDKNFITYSDALSYLSIKSSNFDKVLSKARK